MKEKKSYQHFEPNPKLIDYIHSFWVHTNFSDKIESFTFAPDGFFKIIIFYQEGKIVRYFLTGIFDEPKEVFQPPKTIGIGCRFKILAPEYLLNRSVANLLNKEEDLSFEFMNINDFDYTNLNCLKLQWENELLKIMPNKTVSKNKLELSRLVYRTMGSLNASEVSKQVFWEYKQINRYFKKQLGVTLKMYMQIQRAYSSYFDIRKGKLSPTTDSFYDQSHFVKEIKKFTGVTPKEVFKTQEEQFKQINSILKK